MQSISHLRRIPQMIELLNSGDTEEPAIVNVDFQPSWDQLLGDVFDMVKSNESDGEANDVRNGHHFDGDCTMMQDD